MNIDQFLLSLLDNNEQMEGQLISETQLPSLNVSKDNILNSISIQLQTYNKTRRSSKEMIKAVNLISEGKSVYEIRIALKEGQGTSPLDRDTVNLTHHYLILD